MRILHLIFLLTFLSESGNTSSHQLSCRSVLSSASKNLQQSSENRIRDLIRDNVSGTDVDHANQLYKVMTDEVLDAGIFNFHLRVQHHVKVFTRKLKENPKNTDGGDLSTRAHVIVKSMLELVREEARGIPFGTSRSDLLQFDVFLMRKEIELIKELEQMLSLDASVFQKSNLDKNSFSFLPNAKMGSTGDIEIEFPHKGVTAQFNSSLGTRLIRRNKASENNPIWFVLAHGAGTNQSNAGSFSSVIPSLDSLYVRGTAVAPDSELAGAGIRSQEPIPRLMAANAHLLAEGVREIYQRELKNSRPLDWMNLPLSPMVRIGRSLGATTTLIHDFYYTGQNPYAIKILGSFSNPLTIDAQIKQVLHELEVGIIKNVDYSVLDYASKAVNSFLGELESAPLSRRLAFNVSQLNSVYMIGKADEDGGSRVVQENQVWAQKFTSLAHRWYYRDPILGTKYADQDMPGYSKWFPFLEAKHHLLNSRPNVDEKTASKHFPDLPMELWPKVRNQLVATTALTYGAMDFIIELDAHVLKSIRSADTEVQSQVLFLQSKARDLRAYRDWLLSDLPVSERSFLSLVLSRHSIKSEELENVNWRQHFQLQDRIRQQYIREGQRGAVSTSSGLSLEEYQRQDLLARIAQINHYYSHSELNRVKRELKLLGLLK